MASRRKSPVVAIRTKKVIREDAGKTGDLLMRLTIRPRGRGNNKCRDVDVLRLFGVKIRHYAQLIRDETYADYAMFGRDHLYDDVEKRWKNRVATVGKLSGAEFDTRYRKIYRSIKFYEGK